MALDKDEKVASKDHIPNSRLSYNQKDKIDVPFMTKTAENHTVWGGTYLYLIWGSAPQGAL